MSTSLVRWEPSSLGRVKINSDGSFIKTGEVGGADYIIRSNEGTCLTAGALKRIVMSALEMEAWGALAGIRRAKQMGHRNIILELDSRNLVQIINGKAQTPWRLWNVLNDIMQIVNSFDLFVCNHCLREANMAADRLADIGRGSTVDLLWGDDPPPDIACILYRDLGTITHA